MAMRNLTGLIALGALALAGFATVTALGISRDVRARDGSPTPSAEAYAALEARLGALELAVMLSTTGVGGKPPALPDDARPAGLSQPETPSSSAAPGSPATGLAAAPKPAPTIAEMERRVAELERQLAGAGTPPAVTAIPDIGMPMAFGGMDRYVSSVDDAEKHLELTPAQKADLERVVADVAREREALHRLPGEEGKTWEDAAKEGLRILGDGMIQYDGEKLAAFRERQIPGRSESFGAADRRITETARKRVEDGLTPDQRKRLEKTNVDGLLGGGAGGGSSISIMTTGSFFAEPPTTPEPAGGK